MSEGLCFTSPSLPAIAKSWKYITDTVQAFCKDPQYAILDCNSLRQHLHALIDQRLGDAAVAWCMKYLKDGFKQFVVPQFWGYFNKFAIIQKECGSGTCQLSDWCYLSFRSAIRLLDEAFAAYLQLLALLEDVTRQEGLQHAFTTDMRAHVHYSQQASFGEVARLFFEKTFQRFALLHEEKRTVDPRDEILQGSDQGVINDLAEVCVCLHKLEMVDRCAPVCMHMLYQKVDAHIDALCDEKFSEPVLCHVTQWVEEVVFPWLAIFASSADRSAEDHPLYHQWRTRMEYFVYHTYGNHRLAHFFDIVVEFPDSEPAVVDLQNCLSMTAQHQQLTFEGKRQIRQRLLHAGAKTTDILRFYINLIKTIDVLYNHGSMLEQISEDIKAYVRQRKDTVRSIVLGMINDTQQSDDLADLLHEELKSSNEDNTLTVYYSSDEEETIVNPSQGKPCPLRNPAEGKVLDLAKVLGLSQKTDIIKTLVSIFGDKDIFVEEYRGILASKLLALTDYDTTQEVVTLELLKIRFGEVALQTCEAMVKDISEAKRINANVAHMKTQDHAPPHPQVECTILSKLFWPEMSSDDFTPHPNLEALQQQYCGYYKRLKAPRTLQWMPSHGHVTLELNYGTTTFPVTANPLQASILLHFQDQTQWSEAVLAEALGIEVHILRRHLQFWTSKGVIAQPFPTQYVLNEEPQGVTIDGTSFETEEDSAQPLTLQPKELDWKSIEPFIINTLTNLQSLDLTGIYNYLKWLATDPPFTQTEAALREHLLSMIHDDILVLENGKYRLRNRRR